MKRPLLRPLLRASLLSAALGGALPAWADAVDTLREFVRDVKTGRARFTQTVSSPDAAKKPKSSSGSFEFSRPDRFRFAYDKPNEQLIVGDGRKVWLYDAELNQASSRPLGQAIGATPAALLAGTELERDFTLKPLPPAQGLEWAEAVPRARDGAFQSLKVGFKDKALAAVEITDSFGQRSLLQFSDVVVNAAVSAEHFRFTPPPGTDVIEQ